MCDKKELYNKTREVFPDMSECRIDVKVEYDQKNSAYVVDLKKDNRNPKTYLEPQDDDLCMDGRQCAGRGFQIAQAGEKTTIHEILAWS